MTVLSYPVFINNNTIARPCFTFEKDFFENGIRCIPMLVRFKLDLAGIKLKLKEWVKFTMEEKEYLSDQSCDTAIEITTYRNHLKQLVRNCTGHEPTEMTVDQDPAWARISYVNPEVDLQAICFGWKISLQQWQNLTNLQRFALLKLCRPGHENENFPKAMREFNLTNPL